MNLLEFNKKSTTGVEVYDFNCGGLALGTFDWYEPRDFSDAMNDGYPVKDALAYCVENIMDDFPFLEHIQNPDEIPNNVKVIGFRFCVSDSCSYCDDYECEDCDIANWSDRIHDFHFIVRWEGEWYHKPGPGEISITRFNPWDCWDCGNYDYNSQIVWFADYTAEPWHGYS